MTAGLDRSMAVLGVLARAGRAMPLHDGRASGVDKKVRITVDEPMDPPSRSYPGSA